MGRRSKLNLTSLSFLKPSGDYQDTRSPSSSSSSSSSSWAWPICAQQPRTHSFRSCAAHTSYSTDSVVDPSDDDTVESDEAIIRGLVRPDRLLLEPRGQTSSILDEASSTNYDHKSLRRTKNTATAMVMEMESRDPYWDFRRSMEEMVVVNGMVKDWEGLEEMLGWYLRANGKRNHGFVVGAFVDLLVGLSFC
ncbi:uncharacterized protein A4U43_C02F7750 [Asparagus officinalis]|uniref:Transcription repressor n=1 Tax=Asparagus officinalis TaxID=4686 RepID=A0A5P1FLT4_ASPOF|nr:transcription repressor OFP15-like [Asparagus officinalis]ONK77550.1 uncharacterized protein A4U43_C02F7750 [Asparagus officinalis]